MYIIGRTGFEMKRLSVSNACCISLYFVRREHVSHITKIGPKKRNITEYKE